MNKSVLASIKPKFCELIASGEKTVEIRKNRPKIDVPFKCYIYCTNISPILLGRPPINTSFTKCDKIQKSDIDYYNKPYVWNGKVIGEFVCDDIKWNSALDLWIAEEAKTTLQGTCLTKEDVYKYLGVKSGTRRYNKKYEFYALHISDLKIYDEPKELGEFIKYNRTEEDCYFQHLTVPNSCQECKKCSLTRPPQSWCYVEELEV